MSKGYIGGAALGTSLKAFAVDKPMELMNKQVVFHPQDCDANSIKAKVEIEKTYNGATLKAGLSFGGDNSIIGEMLRGFAGEFDIRVEKEEEIEDAKKTIGELQAFVNEFVGFAKKALGMYPEMAKKEEGVEDEGLAKMAAMLKPMENGNTKLP